MPARVTRPLYVERPSAVPEAALESLRADILASPHLGASRLSDRFARTLGFSVVFTRAGLPRMLDTFPSFAPFLHTALTETANAFYLNPLVLTAGARVGPHIDTSLSSRCGVRVTPERVSVLYVQVPRDLRGGQLVLRTRRHRVGQVEPDAGMLVDFDGQLVHSVRSVRSASARISVVCEQYALDDALLERIPTFTIDSGLA